MPLTRKAWQAVQHFLERYLSMLPEQRHVTVPSLPRHRHSPEELNRQLDLLEDRLASRVVDAESYTARHREDSHG